MSWVRRTDGTIFETEDEAREACRNELNWDDIEAALGYTYTTIDLLKELARLDSPLYYTLFGEAEDIAFDEWYSEEEEEEEEEEEDDPFHENDPYVVTNPMAFY